MSPLLLYLVVASLALLVSMTLTWIIQLYNKNAGIVDVTWSYNFAILAYIAFTFGDGLYERKVLMATVAIIWSFRLGTYLYNRNVGKPEESRYAKLRSDWGKWANIKMLFFYYLQAVFNLILSIPFVILSFHQSESVYLIEYLGAAIVLISVLGEGLSDWQLARFKKNPSNKGKVCNTGLWKYSRHPNYFFEWLVWVGFFIMCCTHWMGLIAIIAPAFIYYTLLFMTGIPMTEELMLQSKGAPYKQYLESTSKFFLLPPKKR
jgi:steroid 5-alpha reductase family enzyme